MDFLSDMIARLENGQRAQNNFVYLKYNKMVLEIVQILQNEGFISHYTLVSLKKNNKSELDLFKKSPNFLISKEIKV